jgi:hypothetical protein
MEVSTITQIGKNSLSHGHALLKKQFTVTFFLNTFEAIYSDLFFKHLRGG